MYRCPITVAGKLKLCKISVTSKAIVHRWFHKDLVYVRKDVKAAVAGNKPVVALESTIITHGMPYPSNLKTALSVEKIIKDNKAIPATVGIINGKLIVGLTEEETEYLATQTTDLIKTSRRDMSYVLSKGLSGGTTVSATMLAANMAGISVFVTGGIGGVHRGASETFDVSADLTELGKTPVAVICAGIKSILDIGLTLEYLETQGVPVIKNGSTRYFPSFFTPRSKFKAPYNLESPVEIAKMIDHQFSLKLQSGMVIGVPIPEEKATDGIKIEQIIQNTLIKAKSLNISGKEITPFVLENVSKLTDGKSLQANIGLIENNAKVGAKIAVELARIRSMESKSNQYNVFSYPKTKESGMQHNGKLLNKRPIVIGGSVLDIKATATNVDEVAEATNSGKVHLSFGGVARNIAECLSRLELNPLLISAVGRDLQGELLVNNMKKLNMDISGMRTHELKSTATYSIMANQHGDLAMTVGDMDINDLITTSQVHQHEQDIKDANLVILDGNSSKGTVQCTLEMCRNNNIPVWYEPTCLSKASKPFIHNSTVNLSYASPNFVELQAIHSEITGEKKTINESTLLHLNCNELIGQCLELVEPCLEHINNLVITMGKHGVLVVRSGSNDFLEKRKAGSDTPQPTAYHYQPAPNHLLPVSVKSVSGAGDSFASGMIYGLLQNYDIDYCVKAGLLSAYISLQSYTAVTNTISKETFALDSIHNWATFNSTSIKI